MGLTPLVTLAIKGHSHWILQAHSPPCKGGVSAASIRKREATEVPQTGWSLTRHVSQTHSETSRVSDHPVRAFFRTDPFLLMARLLLRLRPIGLGASRLLCKEGNAPKVKYVCLSKII